MQTILWKGWIQDILPSSKLLFLLKIRTLNFCVLWFFFLVFVLVAFGTALIMIAQVSVFHYSFLFSMNIRWTFSEDNRTKYDPKAWDANLRRKIKQMDTERSSGPAGVKLLTAWPYTSYIFSFASPTECITSTSCFLSPIYSLCSLGQAAYFYCLCSTWARYMDLLNYRCNCK